ncbi:MAG: family 20 glycosylhydrolase [Clostridiales bacterium]|nr:family 20 glycosylhydrolase [Clostridiales bacterium]
MLQMPWKTKGIVLTAPQPYKKEVRDVAEFIERILAPSGVNLVVLQTRYRYHFQKHPECMGYDPLSYDDVHVILDACRRCGIRLVPKMNLLGHQSGLHNTPSDGILHGHATEGVTDFRDGLLRAYPMLDETPDADTGFYARHLCLSHPLLYPVLFDLMDELLDAFEADAMHIGCDEAFNIGQCPRCRGKSTGELFASHISMLRDHLKARGAETMLWSDRLLNSAESGYHEYESSANGTDAAIDTVSKDIICCDWHYEPHDIYRSVDIFADRGFRMMISPWKDPDAARKFIEYAIGHDRGHIDGYLQTTWCSSGELARHYLRGDPPEWHNMPAIIDTLNKIFLAPEVIRF